MSTIRPSLPVRQVCALHERHPTARLVVFVPRPQLGTALQQAVARKKGFMAGLTVTTVEDYASDIAELSLHADGYTQLDAGPRFFLTAHAAQSLDDEQHHALTGGQPLSGMIAPLARTFSMLREHGISPETYRTQSTESSRQGAQAAVFARYERLLRKENLYDTATLLNRATERIATESPDVSDTTWAVMDEVSLSSRARTFVEQLAETSSITPALYRIGPTLRSDAPAPPPKSAAAHFPKAPRPDSSTASPSSIGRLALSPTASLSESDADPVRFWTATGTRREVQAVLDDILNQEHALDTVEIAYTTPDPYLPLIDTLSERYEIPVSLSGGRSIEATRPGQALRGFFDWIANGCPIPDLISLLRSGLLHLDVQIGSDGSDDTLTHRRAATILAEKRYPEDCRKYSDTFVAWEKKLEADAQSIADNVDADWGDQSQQALREKKRAVQALKSVVRDLLRLAQVNNRSPVQPTDLAKGGEKFLEQFGPTPKPSGPEETHSPDEAARNRLIERLRGVSDREDDLRLPPAQLAGRMKTWMGLTPYVRAQRSQPGRAHVVPLESAGYANRKHLYVVGLDAASTRAAVPDDPLLADDEREALSTDGRTLPLRRAEADAEAWRTRRALARHEGPVTLSASTYNLADAEDLFEAPLYLRLKEASQSARGVQDDASDPKVNHHPLAPSSQTLLSDLDRWTSRTRPEPDVLTDALTHHFPWIQDGLDAAAARASTTYTVYDGLLSARDHPGLDPLARSRPVSAGQLETYAQAPFAYFLQHVLGVEPLDEPALDDVAWLDARGRGAVLHDTFKRFMAQLGRQPTLDDAPLLERVFTDVLSEKRDELPPPSEVVFAATRRQLWNDARLFLRAEAARNDDHTPHDFEKGFGYPPHRRSESDYPDPAMLQLGLHTFTLRGRIDRIDRQADGAFRIWDYKTGSSRSYDDTDLLSDFHLQWALYAYAYENLEDVTVSTAGYFFTSTDEMGKRVSASPTARRTDVAQVVEQVSDGIAGGAFPLTDADALRYSFTALFQNYNERQKQLNAKEWPDDRPPPPSLRE